MSLKLFVSITVALFGFTRPFAQLKVHSSGAVSIGTTANTGWVLTVNGYAGILTTYGGSYLRMNSGPTDGTIGSNKDRIDFWTSPSGHNLLVAQHYYVMSDSSRKTDIVPINNGLGIVMSLNPVAFLFKSDSTNVNLVPGYGFIAQEVELILPQIVDTSKGLKAMSYDQIIPFLVDAVQTQQAKIDSLTSQIDSLNNRMIVQEQCDCKVKKKSAESTGKDFEFSFISESGETHFIELGQNNPNPFKESTMINYVIPETTTSAQIIIYDLHGKELEAYDLRTFGAGQITVDGHTFKPGMYVYALIVDGNYIDSKKMILTK